MEKFSRKVIEKYYKISKNTSKHNIITYILEILPLPTQQVLYGINE